jgi:single-strand DNA-binding protein
MGGIEMNLIVLTGRLTRDPELKYGQSGKAYSRFSLAVDRTFPKGEADFINCVAFDKTAELVGEYLRKGKKVGVQGSLQMNKYEVNGEKRTSYDVIVRTLEFLDAKGGSSDNASPQESSHEGFADNTADMPVPEKDDEFPF